MENQIPARGLPTLSTLRQALREGLPPVLAETQPWVNDLIVSWDFLGREPGFFWADPMMGHHAFYRDGVFIAGIHDRAAPYSQGFPIGGDVILVPDVATGSRGSLLAIGIVMENVQQPTSPPLMQGRELLGGTVPRTLENGSFFPVHWITDLHSDRLLEGLEEEVQLAATRDDGHFDSGLGMQLLHACDVFCSKASIELHANLPWFAWLELRRTVLLDIGDEADIMVTAAEKEAAPATAPTTAEDCADEDSEDESAGAEA